MTSNWKTMRNTLVWLLVAVITMGIVISSPYLLKSNAASLPTVKSCKGLTVKKVGNDWVTVNAKGAQVNYTGVASNSNGWWRVENGKVNFKANGVFSNDFGWWDVEGGKVNFKGNSIYPNAFGWWKCTGGKVTFQENGVFNNKFGWWKVQDSKVDFSFTGIAGNQYGDWYIEKGQVDFSANGSYKYQGKNYIIENGKATPTDVKPADRKEEAVEVVKEILKEMPVSRAALIDMLTDKEVLEDDVFTLEDATYGVDHAGVNWENQCQLAAAELLLEEDGETPFGISRDLLEEFLKEDKYTNSEVAKVMALVDKDYPADSAFWNQSALIAAQDIVDVAKEEKETVTRDDVKEILKDGLLFTEAQAAYGAQNVKL